MHFYFESSVPFPSVEFSHSLFLVHIPSPSASIPLFASDFAGIICFPILYELALSFPAPPIRSERFCFAKPTRTTTCPDFSQTDISFSKFLFLLVSTPTFLSLPFFLALVLSGLQRSSLLFLSYITLSGQHQHIYSVPAQERRKDIASLKEKKEKNHISGFIFPMTQHDRIPGVRRVSSGCHRQQVALYVFV